MTIYLFGLIIEYSIIMYIIGNFVLLKGIKFNLGRIKYENVHE